MKQEQPPCMDHEGRIASLETRHSNYDARLDTMMNTIHSDMCENKKYHREQIDEMKKSHSDLHGTVCKLVTTFNHIKWLAVGGLSTLIATFIAIITIVLLMTGDLTLVGLLKSLL